MTIEDILKLGIDKIHGTLCIDLKKAARETDTWIKEYKGDHAILKRPNKEVGKGATKTTVKTAKEVVLFQKKIVHLAAAFLFGNEVQLSVKGDEPEKYKEVFKALINTWDSNKLHPFNKKLARKLFIETKVAELWYIIPKVKGKKESKNKLRVRLICKSTGDEIYPHYDDYGDMDAFTRKYETKDADGKAILHVDIYTANIIIYHSKESAGDWKEEKQKNLMGKIPVIYYDIDVPEWGGVQTLIDRYEMLVSRFADTNDYFGSPAIQLKGEIENPPEKEEVGRVFRIKSETGEDGKIVYPGGVEYVTWQHAPESIRLELTTLKDLIFLMTSTPDLGFQNVKGTRSLSGQALEFMFLDSLLKAKDHQEVFGEGLARRVNLLKTGLAIAESRLKNLLDEMKIGIEFSSVLPQNIKELIESLSTARGGEAIMSQETAVEKNPLVENPIQEVEKLKKETQELSKLAGSYEV